MATHGCIVCSSCGGACPLCGTCICSASRKNIDNLIQDLKSFGAIKNLEGVNQVFKDMERDLKYIHFQQPLAHFKTQIKNPSPIRPSFKKK